MEKEKYRLPDYKYTDDQELYFKTWGEMGEKLLKIFFKKEDNAYLMGYDPGFLFGDDKKTINIPCWAAINLLNNIGN